MASSIFESIEILSKEKGIDPQIVISAVKDAMLVAARKQFKTAEDLAAEFDEKGTSVKIFAVKRVVEEVQDPVNELTLGQAIEIDPLAQVGTEIKIPKGTESLGRISAQTAKQVILQKVREAERETIFGEYNDRVGELVNCTIKRIEGLDLICDLGKAEARLPKKEQSKLENFAVSDRVRCVIKSVEKTGKNAGVIVSRAVPELVVRLFEQEVPEIYDGTVVVKGCAREAGERTKIAVMSRDRDVDCVGACVGMKGMRVQSIIRELRGEKIDIIEYSEDPVQYATKALSPAKISRVSIISGVDHHMEVIVDDTQLSLAIGKKGQNVRLAAKLLNWKIDIKSEEEKRQEVESQMAALVAPGAPVTILQDFGIPEHIVEALAIGGVTTVERLGDMTPEDLESIPSVGEDWVERLRDAVIAYYGQYEEAGGAVEEPESHEQLPSAEMGIEPSEVEEADGRHDGDTGEPAGLAPDELAPDEQGDTGSEGEAVVSEGEVARSEDEAARSEDEAESEADFADESQVTVQAVDDESAKLRDAD